MGELRVPDPGLPDPAGRAAALRLGVLPGQHLGLPELRAARGARPRPARVRHPLWHVARRADLRRLLHARRPGRRSSRWSRSTTGSATRRCVVKGQVRMVRRRIGGGYFTILTPPEGASPTQRVAYRSRYVHVAVGYPGPEVPARPAGVPARRTATTARSSTPTSRTSRSTSGCSAAPGTVLVRGGGIVASRVLQRLIDDRDRLGLQTQILHLFRTYVTGSHGPHLWMRRRGGDGWAYQGFNYPKSVWGGQLKARVRKLEGAGARRPLRGVRRHQHAEAAEPGRSRCERGRREGWYRAVPGRDRDDGPGPNGDRAGAAEDRDRAGAGRRSSRVIDCTGLEADIREHRVLADLLDHCGAGRNPLRPARRRAHLRGARHPQRAGPDVRLGHAPRWAATSRASTPSSGCRSPPRRSPTTSPGRASARRSGRCGRPASGGSGPAETKI